MFSILRYKKLKQIFLLNFKKKIKQISSYEILIDKVKLPIRDHKIDDFQFISPLFQLYFVLDWLLELCFPISILSHLAIFVESSVTMKQQKTLFQISKKSQRFLGWHRKHSFFFKNIKLIFIETLTSKVWKKPISGVWVSMTNCFTYLQI